MWNSPVMSYEGEMDGMMGMHNRNIWLSLRRQGLRESFPEHEWLSWNLKDKQRLPCQTAGGNSTGKSLVAAISTMSLRMDLSKGHLLDERELFWQDRKYGENEAWEVRASLYKATWDPMYLLFNCGKKHITKFTILTIFKHTLQYLTAYSHCCKTTPEPFHLSVLKLYTPWTLTPFSPSPCCPETTVLLFVSLSLTTLDTSR